MSWGGKGSAFWTRRDAHEGTSTPPGTPTPRDNPQGGARHPTEDTRSLHRPAPWPRPLTTPPALPGPAPRTSSSPFDPPPAHRQAPPQFRLLPSAPPSAPCVSAAARNWRGTATARARASWGGTSGGAGARLPAAREGGPAGLRDMKVSPAAAGRGSVRVPAPAPPPRAASVPLREVSARTARGKRREAGADERACWSERTVGGGQRAGEAVSGGAGSPGGASADRCGRASGREVPSGRARLGVTGGVSRRGAGGVGAPRPQGEATPCSLGCTGPEPPRSAPGLERIDGAHQVTSAEPTGVRGRAGGEPDPARVSTPGRPCIAGAPCSAASTPRKAPAVWTPGGGRPA